LTVPHVIITHVVSEPIPTSRRMSEPDKCIPSTIKSAPICNDEASLDEKHDAMMARGVTNIGGSQKSRSRTFCHRSRTFCLKIYTNQILLFHLILATPFRKNQKIFQKSTSG
jgi:hypothetical protein